MILFIPKYEISRLILIDDISSVYEAVHAFSGMKVCIKVFKPEILGHF
jgi:hypothetical protein